MATADQYANWIVKNADKKGTPDFETVAKAYQQAKAEEAQGQVVPEASGKTITNPFYSPDTSQAEKPKTIEPVAEAAQPPVEAAKPVAEAAKPVALEKPKQEGSNFDRAMAAQNKAFEEQMAQFDKPPETEFGKGVESGQIAVKTIPQSLSVIKDVSAAKTNLNMISLYDQIDKGEITDPLQITADDFTASRARMYLNSRPEIRNKLRENSVNEIKDRRDLLNDSVDIIKQYQKERLKYKGKTENLTDVDGLSDFSNWAAYNFGSGMIQLAPVMVAAVVTGGGGAIATGTSMELSGGVQTRITKILEDTKDITDPELRSDKIRDYVLKTGDVTMAAALAAGTVDALLGPSAALLKKPMAEIVKNLTRREVAKQIPKEALKQGTEEFIAGGTQEAINIAAERALGEQTGEFLSDENIKRLINAASAESVAGFGVGAATKTAQAVSTPPGKGDQVVPPPVEPTDKKPAADMGEYWAGTASDYGLSLSDIQNRDRTRAASIQQIQSIAANPDYNRVSVSGSLSSGAPVVITDTPIAPEALGTISEASATDGTKIPVQYAVVEASSITPSNNADGSPNQGFGDKDVETIRPVVGNGRVAGLQLAYDNKNAGTYRDSLINDPMHGIDPQAIAAMQNPVLVRVMPKNALTPDIADKGNVSGELGMSPTEQAKIDMGRFDLNGVDFREDGSPSENAVTGFVAAMPKEEQGELRDANGRPNKKALERLSNAIFARAYGNDALIDLHAEAQDPEAQTIMRGLSVAAPGMAQLDGAGDHDIRGSVIEAVELAVNAKRQGAKLSDFAKQTGITNNPYTNQILNFLADNVRSAKKIGEDLRELADLAGKQSQIGTDMFGVNAAMSPDQVMQQWGQDKGLGVPPAVTPPAVTPPAKPVETKETHQFAHLTKTPLEIEQEIRGKSIPELANWAVKNAPNKFARAIAEAVEKRILAFAQRGVPMSLEILNDANVSKKAYGSVTGKYKKVPKGFKGTVGSVEYLLELNGSISGQAHDRMGTNYRTILHELLHIATMGTIKYGGSLKIIKDLNNLYKQVRKQIEADLASGKDVPFEMIPATKDSDELLAWGLTNVETQNYLKQVMVAPRKSAYQKFAQLVRELIGMEEKYQSAIEQIVSISEEMLDMSPQKIAKAFNTQRNVLGTPYSATPAASGAASTSTKPETVETTTESKAEELSDISVKDKLIANNPSYRRATAGILRRLRDGKITSEQAAELFKIAYENTKKEVESADRERGEDIIIEKLRAAKRRGEISAEGVLFAEWLMRKNPNLFRDLAISTITSNKDSVSGEYNPYMRLMTLLKGSDQSTTAVHEMLHHLERMMPADVQQAIRKLWADRLLKQAMKAMDGDNPKLQRFFDLLTDFHFGSTVSGGRIIADNPMQEATKLIQSGLVPYEMYQFVNPSEFWAVNGTDIMMDRFNASPRILARLKQWLKEFVQKAKSLLGMQSNSKIAKALDSIIAGDGEFQTNKMLSDASLYQSIEKKSVSTDKAFDRFSKDLRDRIDRQFKPESKNIIDKLKGLQDRFWQRTAQGVADQYRTIKDYDYNAYILARLSKSIDGALEGMMFHGHVYLHDGALDIKRGTEGLLKILEPVGAELDVYQIWVAANRDARLPAEKRSIDPAIVAARDELADGTIDGKPRKEVYESVLKEMNKLNKSVLDIALKQGIIDQAGYERFASDIYYIPFYKAMEGEDAKSPATASGLSNQYFSKELKGGQRPFGDLMENTLRNWSHILSASMKNQAAVKTIEAAMLAGAAYPNLKSFETKDGVRVPIQWRMEPDENGAMRGQIVFEKTGKPIPAELDDQGNEIYAEGELRPYLTEQKAGMAKVMMNGSPAYFEITDPLLLDSIMSIGYMGPQNKFLDAAKGFKNILQFGVTLSPGFKVRNLFRDSISAIAVSDMRLNPVANIMQGWALANRNNPAHISALAGGAIFNFGSAYEGDQSKMVKRLIKQGVKEEDILDTADKINAGLKKAWDAYTELGNKSESANRMALYQQMIDRGMSHLEASFYARDMLDFSMQGSWRAFRLASQTIPFLNARVQGLYKLGRDGITPTSRVIYNTVTGKPIDATDRQKAAQFSIVTGAVAFASMALYLTFKDDEEFKKREQWDRDNFWWIRIPGMDKALRIPKPFEIGAFGTMAERTLEQIMDKDVEGKVFGDSIKRMMVDTFAINHPQFYRPLLDLYANKDSFTGAPIETAGMERLSKAERMSDTTSPLSIALSRVQNVFAPASLEISPVQTEYAIKAYLGWLGGTAEFISHYAVMPFSKGTSPNHDWSETMSMGFIKSLPATQSKYMTSFYENSKEISQAYADMRHYAEIGNEKKLEEIIAEKGDLIALEKSYDRAAKNMARVRKAISITRNDEDMTGEQKKEEIDRLKILNNEIAENMEKARVDWIREKKAEKAAGR